MECTLTLPVLVVTHRARAIDYEIVDRELVIEGIPDQGCLDKVEKAGRRYLNSLDHILDAMMRSITEYLPERTPFLDLLSRAGKKRLAGTKVDWIWKDEPVLEPVIGAVNRDPQQTS